MNYIPVSLSWTLFLAVISKCKHAYTPKKDGEHGKHTHVSFVILSILTC